MLAAVCTMWDVLSWGGETQALIFNPATKKVIAVNALGAAPSGATPEFYKQKGYKYPPATGPLSAVTPGTPGGLLTMLAEFGTLSLKDVLGPALEMAEGYPMPRFGPGRLRGSSCCRTWEKNARDPPRARSSASPTCAARCGA
jgi:gamma-glutamyltranspeptidase/glutathione hydrolase